MRYTNHPPETLSPWLTYTDSLTDKLKQLAPDIRLEVLSHTWILNTNAMFKEPILQREILMWAGNHCCWYARTIIPDSTYQSQKAVFSRLNAESLGELIWKNKDFKRRKLQHKAITTHSEEYHFLTEAMHQNAPKLWARHSTIDAINPQALHFPFDLLEIFLPDFMNYYL